MKTSRIVLLSAVLVGLFAVAQKAKFRSAEEQHGCL